MWQFAALFLALAPPAGQRGITFDDELFGARQRLTCTWFSNFESSRFVQCENAKGELLEISDGASVKCVRNLCRQMDEAARKAIDWKRRDAPWGHFKVVLVGRLSLYPHEKRYIGDGTRTVLVEELTSVLPAE